MARTNLRYYIANVVRDSEGLTPEGGVSTQGTHSHGFVYLADEANQIYVAEEPDDLGAQAFFLLSVPQDCSCRAGKCVVCDDEHVMHKAWVKQQNLLLIAENLRRMTRNETQEVAEPMLDMVTAVPHDWDTCPNCSDACVCEQCNGTCQTIIPAEWVQVAKDERKNWRVV